MELLSFGDTGWGDELLRATLMTIAVAIVASSTIAIVAVQDFVLCSAPNSHEQNRERLGPRRSNTWIF